MALLSDDVDLKLISLCFGNCSTENSLRNTLSTFYVLELEEKYRRERNKEEWPLDRKISHSKPVVSIGLTTALDGTQLDATYFHGEDGLGNVHTLAPEYTAPKDWMEAFESEAQSKDLPFIPSKVPSYEHILRILKEEEADTVVIVAIGPLMNLAKAAEMDPETFARVKHVVCMGGALTIPGNVTPYAEFNIFSDALAASKVFDLTSVQAVASHVVPKKIELTLFPLDITIQHLLIETDYINTLTEKGYLEADGTLTPSAPPLVKWSHVWLTTTFNTFKRIYGYDLMTPEERSKQVVGLNMHDPLALFYAIRCLSTPGGDDGWTINRDLDLRVEYNGDLTRGMTVFDSRGKPKRDSEISKDDHGAWLSTKYGNRVNVAVSSPYKGSAFGKALLEALYK